MADADIDQVPTMFNSSAKVVGAERNNLGYSGLESPVVNWGGNTKTFFQDAHFIPSDEWKPLHPEYHDYTKRLKTYYEYWPVQMKQSKEHLASVGLFYSGEGDKVICFSCGIGFYKWDTLDNPYEEHLIHSKNKCKFLKSLRPSTLFC